MLELRNVFSVAVLFASMPTFAEPLRLADGLGIEAPTNFELVYQAIPSFDASKKMLVSRVGDKLQYFIDIDRQPRGRVDSEQYFNRLIRDLDDANPEQALEVIDQGQYTSDTGLKVNYLEYIFTPAGGHRKQHQIAHYLTNSNRSFVAISVLVDEQSAEKMHQDSIAIFKTASISAPNPGQAK